MPVLFGFLSFHLHRRIRYEGYGPWDHMPQDSTGVAEEQPTDSTPAPRVSTTAAHDGAVTDEWESDEDTPETEGAVCLSKPLVPFAMEPGQLRDWCPVPSFLLFQWCLPWGACGWVLAQVSRFLPTPRANIARTSREHGFPHTLLFCCSY